MAGKPGRSGGRNRKSAVLKRLQGNAGHRKITDEAEGKGSVRKPLHFDQARTELWVTALAAMPRPATGSDQYALESYCDGRARLAEIDQIVREEGLTVRQSYGLASHPLLRVRRHVEKNVRDAADNLGLSDFGRKRTEAVPPPEPYNPMTELFALCGVDEETGQWPDELPCLVPIENRDWRQLQELAEAADKETARGLKRGPAQRAHDKLCDRLWREEETARRKAGWSDGKPPEKETIR